MMAKPIFFMNERTFCLRVVRAVKALGARLNLQREAADRKEMGLPDGGGRPMSHP
jgi:hypothetical protein